MPSWLTEISEFLVVFQHIVDGNFPAAFSDEALAVPRHLPQLALLPAGDVAGADEPVPQKVSNPFGIHDVGLAARDVLDVSGIRDNDIESEELKDVVEWFPVGTGALHSDDLAPAVEQPFREFPDFVARCPGFPNFLLLAAFEAGDDELLVNINPTATIVHDFHE